MSSRHSFRSAVCLMVLVSGIAATGGVQAQAALPAMQTQGTARYVCGGIGSDESTAMRAAMKSHPLSLLFARADGSYLADAAVTVRAEGGATALSLRASGPVCLIDLPAGTYAVEATTEGAAQRQNVTVGGAPKTLDFRF